MTPERFAALLAPVMELVGRHPLDGALQARLERDHAPGGAWFDQVCSACREAIAEGWMCSREAGGIRYGRVIKPSAATRELSVDVVDMKDVRGPHHRHPNGEADLIMPVEGPAQFDGHGAGWLVYPPGSAHFPTVSGGRAWVLYLLPGGAIEFTPPA
ncbi:MAG: hypothetical protein OHK0026_16000 [Rhodocyclaceae bacterium]